MRNERIIRKATVTFKTTIACTKKGTKGILEQEFECKKGTEDYVEREFNKEFFSEGLKFAWIESSEKFEHWRACPESTFKANSVHAAGQPVKATIYATKISGKLRGGENFETILPYRVNKEYYNNPDSYPISHYFGIRIISVDSMEDVSEQRGMTLSKWNEISVHCSAPKTRKNSDIDSYGYEFMDCAEEEA